MFFINVTDMAGNTVACFHEVNAVIAYRIYDHLIAAGWNVTIEKGY